MRAPTRERGAQHRLSRLDGTREVQYGQALAENRRQGDYSKDGRAVRAAIAPTEFADVSGGFYPFPSAY